MLLDTLTNKAHGNLELDLFCSVKCNLLSHVFFIFAKGRWEILNLTSFVASEIVWSSAFLHISARKAWGNLDGDIVCFWKAEMAILIFAHFSNEAVREKTLTLAVCVSSDLTRFYVVLHTRAKEAWSNLDRDLVFFLQNWTVLMCLACASARKLWGNFDHDFACAFKVELGVNVVGHFSNGCARKFRPRPMFFNQNWAGVMRFWSSEHWRSEETLTSTKFVLKKLSWCYELSWRLALTAWGNLDLDLACLFTTDLVPCVLADFSKGGVRSYVVVARLRKQGRSKTPLWPRYGHPKP